MTALLKTSTKNLFTASNILGGKAVLHTHPRSSIEWIVLVREGIPASAIDAIIGLINIPQVELSKALNIPERTLIRRKKEGVLNPEESGKLHRLAQVIERAVEVFESAPLALDWIKSPNASLGGFTPLSLLDTDLGAQAIMDTLGRIEHGVFN